MNRIDAIINGQTLIPLLLAKVFFSFYFKYYQLKARFIEFFYQQFVNLVWLKGGNENFCTDVKQLSYIYIRLFKDVNNPLLTIYKIRELNIG